MNDAMVIEVIRKSVTVDCSVEEAFRVFSAEPTTWWPAESHSLHGERVEEIVFEGREGGDVYERTHAGYKGHWATVLAWEPPNRLALAWELTPSLVGTVVEVRFVPEDAGTRVELEHRGWERLGALAIGARDDYAGGWPRVFALYVEAAAS